MAVRAPQDIPPPRGQVPCSYHPEVMTGLRCSRCGKPICPRCGVTMVPAALSADDEHEGEWVCLECEERGEDT